MKSGLEEWFKDETAPLLEFGGDLSALPKLQRVEAIVDRLAKVSG